MRRQG